MSQDLKKLACEYTDKIWKERDLKAVEAFFSSDCIVHSPLGEYHTPKQMLSVIEKWLTAFPNLEVTPMPALCDDERVAVPWSAHGTHQGLFCGVEATGKPIRYHGCTLYRFKEGKICEYWAFVNVQTILDQIKTPSQV